MAERDPHDPGDEHDGHDDVLIPALEFSTPSRFFVIPNRHPDEESPNELSFLWNTQQVGEDPREGWTAISAPVGYPGFCSALGALLGIEAQGADALIQAAYFVAKEQFYLRIDPPGTPGVPGGVPFCQVKHSGCTVDE